MTTATAKYDPFQARHSSQVSSDVHDTGEKKVGLIPETARHYGELYWYSPSSPSVHLHKMSTSDLVPTATAFRKIPAMGGSMSIEGNTIAATSWDPAAPSVFLRKSVYAQPRSRFEVLQKWEGIVLDVLHDSFTARLIDLTRQGADEEAEFALDEIDEGDKDLLKPGAVFYWNVGYSDSLSGRARVSIIRLRRLPIWRKEELERAKRDAERLSTLLEWK
jgi:hypothetical protein